MRANHTGQQDACSRKAPGLMLLAAAQTQLIAQGSHPAWEPLSSNLQLTQLPQAFCTPNVDLFTPPPHTSCLKPSAPGVGRFFSPSIPLPCLLCGWEARCQHRHQPAMQPSSKALRLATADKGLRAGAKSQGGSGKGPGRGGHWLHPMENPSLQQLCWVLGFPSQQQGACTYGNSSLPLLGGGRRCWRMQWGHCVHCKGISPRMVPINT